MRFVWERIVELAIDQDVDLVAVTGDVVDRENRFYEALGPLEEGIRRLAEREIPVFAVSGNHDFDVLPRVADVVDDEYFHLLGRGGKWEERIFERDGKPLLQILGWSFPAQHVRRSPLSSFAADVAPDVPTIGLLHADLDQGDSPYAPVTSDQLEASAVSTWFLGHIHKPQQQNPASGGVILYPGSPQALDPGERGVHGPWIVDLVDGGQPVCRQIPLATVRYRRLPIELDGVDSADEFHRTVPEQIQQDLRQIAESGGPLRQIVYRLQYRGRTALHRKLDRLSDELIDDYAASFEGIEATVDKVEVATTVQRDLEEIAVGQNPPAVLARLLLQIRDGAESEAATKLFARLRTGLNDVHRANAYVPLRADRDSDAMPDDEWVRDQVVVEGMNLLDELLGTKVGE